MTDREFDVCKLLLDRSLLAAIGLWLAHLFSAASDRKRDRAAWARTRAEQRLKTYREISSILGAQLVSITRFSNVVEAANSRPEKIDLVRAHEVANQLIKDIAARHYQDAPALLVAAPFVGEPVAKPLAVYQKIVGKFSRIVEPSYGDNAEPVSFADIQSLKDELMSAWQTLQIAIRDEFNSHPGDDDIVGPTGGFPF